MNFVLFQAKERIRHMEEVDRLMVSESQSTQARNTLLKNQLQKLKGKSSQPIMQLAAEEPAIESIKLIIPPGHAKYCLKSSYRV